MEEKYLMECDEQGIPKAFYLKSIHGDKIPSGVIEITKEQHQHYFENQGKLKFNPQTQDFEDKPEVQPSEIDAIKGELSTIDSHLSRAAEDLIEAMNVDITTLPTIMQERYNKKHELRQRLRELEGI